MISNLIILPLCNDSVTSILAFIYIGVQQYGIFMLITSSLTILVTSAFIIFAQDPVQAIPDTSPTPNNSPAGTPQPSPKPIKK